MNVEEYILRDYQWSRPPEPSALPPRPPRRQGQQHRCGVRLRIVSHAGSWRYLRRYRRTELGGAGVHVSKKITALNQSFDHQDRRVQTTRPLEEGTEGEKGSGREGREGREGRKDLDYLVLFSESVPAFVVKGLQTVLLAGGLKMSFWRRA